MFFKKEKTENNNFLTKICALLIHAAKIDENFTKKEEEIIKRTLNELGLEKDKITSAYNPSISSFNVNVGDKISGTCNSSSGCYINYNSSVINSHVDIFTKKKSPIKSSTPQPNPDIDMLAIPLNRIENINPSSDNEPYYKIPSNKEVVIKHILPSVKKNPTGNRGITFNYD